MSCGFDADGAVCYVDLISAASELLLQLMLSMHSSGRRAVRSNGVKKTWTCEPWGCGYVPPEMWLQTTNIGTVNGTVGDKITNLIYVSIRTQHNVIKRLPSIIEFRLFYLSYLCFINNGDRLNNYIPFHQVVVNGHRSYKKQDLLNFFHSCECIMAMFN